ncbi:MAG: outer membrane protein assembly factor BamA [Treponema sp.]|jgi:outer membrane protein insertion porin family|nr:outer membrane protein assembly factor BamA [Treponema sp.]
MRLGLVVFFVLVLTFSGFTQQQSEDWYQGKPIKDVVFTGLKHVDLSELEGVVEPFIGRSFNDDVFWELQGRLYALEYFDLISPSAVPADGMGNEVIIRFTVTERPIVSRIVFDGNSGIRRTELLDVISLKINDVANQVKLRLDELAITNKYLEKGFPDIQVRAETQTAPDSSIEVTFFITEGEKITIEDFIFEGNSIFSDRTLRSQLTLKAKGIMNDGAFQDAKLIADREAIIQYYHDRGYIDAEVNDVIRDVKKDDRGNNNMIITFRINEGRIYRFGGVAFEGNEIFSGEQLTNLVYSKEGEIVNARRVEADLQRVADLYFENGYIFNTIAREEVRNTAEGLISYKITIVERGRAHIENILVRGNKKTKTNVILREIPLEPGDVFSKTKVLDGMRNLYNLQYFSNVIPETPPGSTDSLMDLIFTVEEQPTMDIQFGLTFSGNVDFPISGMVKWSDRNFLGSGNIIGAELTGSLDIQSLALEYTHRWLFGLPLSGGFDFTAEHSRRLAAMDTLAPFFNGDEEGAYPDGFGSYDEYYNKSKLPDSEYLINYEQWRISLGLSTGYRFTTSLGNLGLNGGIRSGIVRNTYDSGLYRPFDPVLRERNNQWTPANSIWTSISLDQRDLYYDPSQGYYAIQRLGYYGVFSFEKEHYIKSDTKAEYFLTLFNIPLSDTYNFKAVFGIHSGLSFIFKQPFHDSIFVEDANKLAVDGMFIGRGWTGEYSNRGLVLWENWAEIRIPIVTGILAWDFFFDAAGIKYTTREFFSDFHSGDMRYSFGGGLRFTIPQFPFRFLFAKRFKVEDGEVVWQKGALFSSSDSPASGIDFVISFALSTY